MVIILYIVFLLLGIPTGYLIAWLCKDELLSGRKWFKIYMIIAIITGIVLVFMKNYVSAVAMAFIFIVTFVSFKKSFDKKWTKRKS